MRSKFTILIIALIAAAFSTALVGCVEEPPVPQNTGAVAICNGGFETGNLSGWTVEYGDAFDDDSVSSQYTFVFDNDPDRNEISVDKTGNWFLSGKGFDGKRDFAATGAIRSDNFILGGNGKISLKLAGGALTENGNSKGDNVCYVGVYTAHDDKLIAKFTNDYFSKHENTFVEPDKYESGVFSTDNFRKYTKDLSTYMGNEMYIRIVDNDRHWYYGYISVDDIRVGYDTAQLTGAEYTKIKAPVKDETEYTIYDVKNGGFETGTLEGWTIISGDAFSADGVSASKYWWNEAITYNADGKYHYGYYKPSAVGVMRSSEFVVGGSGFVSFKLGGCANRSLTYLKFMLKDEDGDREVARFSNAEYWDKQFPYVANGMKLLNMVQYYADFSEHLGKTMYIEVVDENSAADDGRGAIVLDSVKTYYKEKPVWYDSVAYELKPDPDMKDPETPSEYQVKNGTFETGDLTGWTMSDPENPIGIVTNAAGWWDECLPYNKKGKWLFSGLDDKPDYGKYEKNKGTLTSELFTVGGEVFTFRMGGGGNPTLCYISLLDENDRELARFGNLGFSDKGIGSLNVDSYLANMISYKGHWSALGIEQGARIKIRITDNAENNWGLITADSFITYYESVALVPKNAVEVTNILPPDKALGEDDEYQILNGNFETGDLRGFTLAASGDGDFSAQNALSSAETFWSEGLPYNKGGLFFFDGQKAMGNEPGTFALRSENFKLGGSGRISFKMGGRTAAIKVYEAGGELLAEYRNTEYNADDAPIFPYIDRGCRILTMTTYVADLSEHLGKTLYLELCDFGGAPWGFATFDDIITYYETAPDLENSYDVVKLTSKTSAEGDYNYKMYWKEAIKQEQTDEA